MLRRPTWILFALLLLALPSSAQAKSKNICTSAAGKAKLKSDGSKLQTLRSGQYYAYRFKGGTWTFCDSKRASVNKAFKSFFYDFDNQKNTGVKLFSRPGKCVVLQLKPRSTGYPSLPAVDMRPTGGAAGSTIHQIDFQAPGARVVSVELSSTCLLGIGYVSADGSRHIQLNPIIKSAVQRQSINLSDKATDADLRTLTLSGNKASWTDAGVDQSR